MKPRILELRQAVLDKNDRLAQELRTRFEAAGVFTVNLVSSPGAGKTALLEETLRRMQARELRVAAIVGDLATENDARRLARSGAPVRQIETGGLCHLEADLVARRLEGWTLTDFDFLFIENVGNLVCPSDYDLGEALRVALLATTEGEDKPLKYPPMFHSADVVMLTKCDLSAAVEFDRAAAVAAIEAIAPHARILETSARTGAGIDAWIDLLVERRAAVMRASHRS
ncbi:MAG: hydrogenase nickel incorporation protein HypB [Chloroflexota bacterium]|nr:MAG: hydrogenase nickel incorporation protein HypB [Chloroflexota bacterium]